MDGTIVWRMNTKLATGSAAKPGINALTARQAVLKRMKGMWKGVRGKAILREMRAARKSWDRYK